MGFVLSEDQQMLRDTAETFMAEAMPVSRLRGLRGSGAQGRDAEGAAKLAELGFFQVMIPDGEEGEHFGLAGLGQVLEMQGRTLAVTPLIETALIGTQLLLPLAGDGPHRALLDGIAAGEVRTSLALNEGTHFAPQSVVMTAEGGKLSGRKRFVPGGQSATHFIVAAREGEADGMSLFMVPADASGLSVHALDTLDAHGAAHLDFDGVSATDAERLGGAGEAGPALTRALDMAATGMAAEMLGTASAAFDMTLTYLQERKQFGQLIGSFQALQHRAAQMFTELELTRSCVAEALSAADDPDTAPDTLSRLASLAKARAGETVHLVTNETVQMHGGTGMTDDHDAGLFLKRARVQEALYGSASWHRDRYARLKGY